MGSREWSELSAELSHCKLTLLSSAYCQICRACHRLTRGVGGAGLGELVPFPVSSPGELFQSTPAFGVPVPSAALQCADRQPFQAQVSCCCAF